MDGNSEKTVMVFTKKERKSYVIIKQLIYSLGLRLDVNNSYLFLVF